MAARRPAAATAAALAAVLLASGCAARGPARPTADPLPSGMPSGVPLLPGAVVSSSSAGPGDWLVAVASDDPERDYRKARTLLVDGGFTLTKDREGTGGGDGQACTARLCVGFTGSGTTVSYEVFLAPTSGAP